MSGRTWPEHSRLEMQRICLAPEPPAMPPRSKKVHRVSDETQSVQSARYYLGNLRSRGPIHSPTRYSTEEFLVLTAERCVWFIPLPTFLIPLQQGPLRLPASEEMSPSSYSTKPFLRFYGAYRPNFKSYTASYAACSIAVN